VIVRRTVLRGGDRQRHTTGPNVVTGILCRGAAALQHGRTGAPCLSACLLVCCAAEFSRTGIKAAPLRSAAARRQRRLCLARPAGARRAGTRTKPPDQLGSSSSTSEWHRCIASAPSGQDRDRTRPYGRGSLIRFRLCSPLGQAGQGRSLWSRRRGDDANATLDSPVLPGGSGSYRMRHLYVLSM
jgi:hypothetical protein